MPKTKEQKQVIVEDLKEKLAKQKAMVLVGFEGLDSKAFFQLRDDLKRTGCLLQVVKKTLLKKVLEGLKEKELKEKIENITGQLALVFGFEDEVMPAKTCYQFSRASQDNEKLEILGGILGKEFLAKEKMIELAQIPSKPELLAKLVGSLQSTMSKFANVLQGNIKGLVYALNAIQKSK